MLASESPSLSHVYSKRTYCSYCFVTHARAALGTDLTWAVLWSYNFTDYILMNVHSRKSKTTSIPVCFFNPLNLHDWKSLLANKISLKDLLLPTLFQL